MKFILTALLCASIIHSHAAFADVNRCLGVGRGEVVYSTEFQKSFFRELENLLVSSHQKADTSMIRSTVKTAKAQIAGKEIKNFQKFLEKLDLLFTRSENTLCRSRCDYSEIKNNQEELTRISKILMGEIATPAKNAGLRVGSIVKYLGLTTILGGTAFVAGNVIQRMANSIFDGFVFDTASISSTLAVGTVSIVLVYALSKGVKAIYSDIIARPLEPYVSHLSRFFMRAVGNKKPSDVELRDMLHKLFYESERTLTRVEVKLRDRLVEIYRASWSELKNIVKDFNNESRKIDFRIKSDQSNLQNEIYRGSYRVLVAHTANWLVRISNLYPELMIRLTPSEANPSGLNPILISIFSPIFAKIQFTKNGLRSEIEAERTLEQAMRTQFVVHVMNAAVKGEPNRVFKQSESPAYKKGDKYVFPETTQSMKLAGDLKAIESMLLVGLRLPDYSQLNLSYKNGKAQDALSELLADLTIVE